MGHFYWQIVELWCQPENGIAFRLIMLEYHLNCVKSTIIGLDGFVALLHKTTFIHSLAISNQVARLECVAIL